MPEEKRKLQWQGRDVWVVNVPVEHSSEAWNTYLLADGSSLRMKTVVTDVARIVEPAHFDEQGNPTYLVQSMNIVRSNSPNNLRRTEEG